MPINTGDNDASQLLEEISKLKIIGGSNTGFKYVKHVNCNISANQLTKIIDRTNDTILREVLVINRTPDAPPNTTIKLYWNDGQNNVILPDILDSNNTHYIDYSDGGLELLVESNANANIDIYVRSTKPINYQVGNIVEIPLEEEVWYSLGSFNYQYIEPFKIPIKPVFLSQSIFQGSSLIEMPVSEENGYDVDNKRNLGRIGDSLFLWEGFLLKKYHFLVNTGESDWFFYFDISQDSEKWIINLV